MTVTNYCYLMFYLILYVPFSKLSVSFITQSTSAESDSDKEW